MTDATQLPFDLPALHRRKLTVDFAGGNQSSDGGLLLLRAAEKRIGIVDRLAAALRDRRDPTRILHTMPELLKTRIFAIDCGYADGNDLNDLRVDPALKIAVGRLPETGGELCSQSTSCRRRATGTMSRLENAPTKTEAARLTGALADQFCASFATPPIEIMLDIDDTPDMTCLARLRHDVHGGQQLSFWNAHHDERCFMPIHVYHVVLKARASGTTAASRS